MYSDFGVEESESDRKLSSSAWQDKSQLEACGSVIMIVPPQLGGEAAGGQPL